MSSCPIFSGSSPAVVPLDRAQGKPLQSLEVYQTEEALSLDLQFDDGIALELIFRVGFQASATLLEYTNGDGRVLQRIKPRRKPDQADEPALGEMEETMRRASSV